jgi:hypothetical protein
MGRKPKVIPEGFLWDPKAKELIDTRCNNPKLRKLVRESVNVKDVPALCMSPFFTGTKKRQKQVPWIRYPHIDLLTSNSKLRRMLLGKQLYWTIKEDGENVTIWKKKRPHRAGFDIVVSSHNQEQAAPDMQARVKSFPEYITILGLIHDNPTYRVIVEECRKGTSITRIKKYEKDTLIVVDIFDTTIMNFLPYTVVYQTCYHYGLPTVKLYGITRHKTMKDLLKYKNHILETCEAIKEEGMVVKTFTKDGEYLQSKVKLDTPEPKERVIHEGQVQLPPIPDNEIMGAISHVEGDFGLTGKPKDDMPRIAKAVAEECKKHLYSSRPNLFKFYQEYMENRK